MANILHVPRRIIIPARQASSRFPGKILKLIAGKTMLQHVYERAAACGFNSVLIATDCEQIAAAAKSFGAEVCMTSDQHSTGTDRLAEAMLKMGYDEDDIIVNVQGDEPLIPIENVQQVADNLALNTEAAVATLCEPLHDIKEIMNPNIVKVVTDKAGMALYFSRAAIPWVRGEFPERLSPGVNSYRHVGIYAYRGAFLQAYQRIVSSFIEQWEGLEQLRVLWHGYKIHVDIAKQKTLPGVDNYEDLQRVKRFLGDHSE